jgi:hypothetical protein
MNAVDLSAAIALFQEGVLTFSRLMLATAYASQFPWTGCIVNIRHRMSELGSIISRTFWTLVAHAWVSLRERRSGVAQIHHRAQAPKQFPT